MTSSTGWSGLIFFGSPPSLFIASRIAARSTTAGTPVKSWSRTRAGVKAISRVGWAARVDGGEGLDVLGPDRHVVLRAKQVLEEDLERVRQARGLREPGVDRREAVVREGGRAEREGGAGGEGVGHGVLCTK